MILYVNGDSHTAAAEAVNPHAFAMDDGDLFHLGRLPHPENLAVSWGRKLSEFLKAGFKCDAESASSNQRILRTTREWLASAPTNTEIFVIIQWSTWEREEWLIDGTYYQVNGSGVDQVPPGYEDQYKQWIVDIDWTAVTQQAHDEIWALHQELADRKIPHVFFNGNNHFGKLPESDRRDWGTSYIGPYDPKSTYNQWLLDHGHDTVAPNSWHFGEAAHSAWARFVLQYIIKNKLV